MVIPSAHDGTSSSGASINVEMYGSSRLCMHHVHPFVMGRYWVNQLRFVLNSSSRTVVLMGGQALLVANILLGKSVQECNPGKL